MNTFIFMIWWIAIACHSIFCLSYRSIGILHQRKVTWSILLLWLQTSSSTNRSKMYVIYFVKKPNYIVSFIRHAYAHCLSADPDCRNLRESEVYNTPRNGVNSRALQNSNSRAVNGKSNVKQKFCALKKRYFILVTKYGYNITENIQSKFW